MDENHQDKIESKLVVTEDVKWQVNRKSKLWVPKHKKRTGFQGKTLWDKLNLFGTLAIPIVVALATIAFGIIQFNLANQQHEADQKQALDQQQAAILQTYIDNIQDLLLNHDLLKSKPTDDVAILARARTLTALQGLDPGRKGSLVQFLYEAQLIGFQGDKTDKFKLHDKIIDLSLADLNYANISGANLSDFILNSANLPGANLPGADFSYANLSHADLTSANLTNAILNGANLLGAGLTSADLSYAHLSGATLFGAGLNQANLSGANLSGANLLAAGLIGANLSGANLSGANLSDTGFLFADLRNANFSYAVFIDANLSYANLSHANLSHATFLTQHQLDQVSSCKGAILPKGLTCHHNQ